MAKLVQKNDLTTGKNLHTYTLTRTRTRTRTRTQMHTDTHRCTRKHTHTHTNKHTHVENTKLAGVTVKGIYGFSWRKHVGQVIGYTML